jgi:apolipoprotein N-acyltransferase
MQTGLLQMIKFLPLPLASALCLASALPDLDLAFLAWIGLVPLLIAISGRGVSKAFFLSFLCGICFLLIVFRWILEVEDYSAVHHALLALYLGAYFAIFGTAFAFIEEKWSLGAALASAPFIWVCLEYVKSNFSFLALPWAFLAHGQYQVLPVLQVSSITGAWGVSFLIVAVNAAITALVIVFGSKYGKGLFAGQSLILTPATKLMLGLPFALLLSAFAYGHYVMLHPLSGPDIKVSVIQGNVSPEKVMDRNYLSTIVEPLCNLSKAAAAETPALIVWPENAAPRPVNADVHLSQLVRQTAWETGSSILLGSSIGRKFKTAQKALYYKYFNSAVLVTDAKFGLQRYDKILLLPFGEYLPFKEIIPWHMLGVPDIVENLAGEQIRIFQIPDARFGVTICWENIFPDFFSRFVRNGAQFVVNITNEHWFGKRAAPYQFLSMSVMRAVEHRIYVVRCGNTGVSCFIDPFGRVVDRVKDEAGQDTYVTGFLTGRVVPRDGGTFYTQYGDWFILLCFLVSGGFLVAAWRREAWSGRPKSTRSASA